MKSGALIWLNGPSSVGKTSIGKALQASFETPWYCTGFDHFSGMLHSRYWGRPDGVMMDFDAEGHAMSLRMGAVMHELISGMCYAIIALSKDGRNVIVETGFYGDELQLCLNLLTPYHPCFVGLTCPLEELEQREIARGNRVRGLARLQCSSIQAPDICDVKLDTSRHSIDECARIILSSHRARVRGQSG